MVRNLIYRVLKEDERYRIENKEYLFVALGDGISAQMLSIGRSMYFLEKEFKATFDLDALTLSEQRTLELVVNSYKSMNDHHSRPDKDDGIR